MYKKVLVVDDEQSICEFFTILFRKIASESDFVFEITSADDGKKALELMERKSFDLVIFDLKIPNISGLELLEKGKSAYPQTVFIVITAFGNASTAVKAMKLGAYDYIQKPFNVDDIKTTILSVFSQSPLKKQKARLVSTVVEKPEPKEVSLIGKSLAIQKIHQNIQQLSGYFTNKKIDQKESKKANEEKEVSRGARVNVLITGESGTGKEVVARTVHQNSPLKDEPFVAVNCGAIPETLIESEMFGHKKGSFTGAVADKEGFFEVANGGTLFLDEIGELPLAVQPKLLRALQEKTIRMVGAVEDKKVQVRLIAATNRDLEAMVREGLFREDLFYRLNVVRIHVPPLRERREDIPLLITHFIKKYSEKQNCKPPVLSKDLLELLKQNRYPGNIRELENLIERMMIFRDKEYITAQDVLPLLQDTGNTGRINKGDAVDIALPQAGMNLEDFVGDIEKKLLLQALDRTQGHRREAARLLGLSLRSFRYRLRKYQLKLDSNGFN